MEIGDGWEVTLVGSLRVEQKHAGSGIRNQDCRIVGANLAEAAMMTPERSDLSCGANSSRIGGDVSALAGPNQSPCSGAERFEEPS